VAVTSGARWGSFDDLPDLLADAGYSVAATGNRAHEVLYVKDRCEP
jgi:hypothetical protein